MSFDIRKFFEHPFTATRPPERQVLFVPVHADMGKEPRQSEVRTVLAKAAGQIAVSGLLWRWVRHDGVARLVRWDADEQAFLQDSLADWVTYFGRNWRVTDTDNREYLGPSQLVADRLIAAVLADPNTPVATWALQISRKREGFK